MDCPSFVKYPRNKTTYLADKTVLHKKGCFQYKFKGNAQNTVFFLIYGQMDFNTNGTNYASAEKSIPKKTVIWTKR